MNWLLNEMILLFSSTTTIASGEFSIAVVLTRLEKAQLLLQPCALGNVHICSEHAEDFPVWIAQRHLAREERDGFPVGRCLRFVDEKLAAATLDDLAVIGSIQFRLVSPAHLVSRLCR